MRIVTLTPPVDSPEYHLGLVRTFAIHGAEALAMSTVQNVQVAGATFTMTTACADQLIDWALESGWAIAADSRQSLFLQVTEE